MSNWHKIFLTSIIAAVIIGTWLGVQTVKEMNEGTGAHYVCCPHTGRVEDMESKPDEARKYTRQDLIDADYDMLEYENKIGEGWTHSEIVEDAIRRGYFEGWEIT